MRSEAVPSSSIFTTTPLMSVAISRVDSTRRSTAFPPSRAFVSACSESVLASCALPATALIDTASSAIADETVFTVSAIPPMLPATSVIEETICSIAADESPTLRPSRAVASPV